MPSFSGLVAAVGTIVLGLAGLAGFIWMLDDPDIINNINGWALLGGFVLLLSMALTATYIAASRKSSDAPHIAGAKAVGIQVLKMLLILAGMAGLLIVIGIVIH